MNPGQVNVVNAKTVMALRVSIVNKLTDTVKQQYASYIKNGKMEISTTVVNGVDVDVYTGQSPSSLQGIVCIFKIRDKTAIIQTDAMIFKDDFYKILNSITFNA